MSTNQPFQDKYLDTKIDDAVEAIKHFCHGLTPYVAFSGGKDSVVLMELVRMSGIKYDAHFSVTTVDPPEVLRSFLTSFLMLYGNARLRICGSS